MHQPPGPTLIPTPAQGLDGAISSQNGAPPSGPAHPKRKLKKLRLAVVLLGLTVIAVISTVFGMLMAVASDLPALENRAEYNNARNSELFPDDPSCRAQNPGCRMAVLTGNQNRILLKQGQISPNLKNAVIAIEDQRFYEHKGVDYKGIGRALWQDVRRQSAAQGGSTITQQFVKNALSAQGHRSVLQKMREAALAYHLERKWSKEKILTEYMNTVYFGNGAYGVESAMRTYFGGGDQQSQTPVGTETPLEPQPDPGPRAQDATPEQAALLAGIMSSPTLYDPVQHHGQATHRRNLVLKRMLEQRMITRGQYAYAVGQDVPDESQVSPPRPDSDQPYFSSWLTQQLVDRYRPGPVFGGGLKVKTTIDPHLQQAAEQAISRRLTGVGPEASLVAIKNSTGEIKAMVGGANFNDKPFNLATNGHRQPGSAFKPFTLIAALEDDVSPDATFTSQPKVFPVPGSKKEKFRVANYEDQYSGIASLRSATAASDNSVYAELGLKVGTHKIARLAQRMGLRTPVSHNPAMTLGGLKEGLTPLELAYAYTTIANKGVKISGTLAPGGEGPVAIQKVTGSGIDDQDTVRKERVFPAGIGETAQQLLAGVIQGGTGQAAQIGEFAAGKTGTTENYGDAWFVGFNKELTVAVWVGYPDRLQPMKTEYRGGPVAGGTYPAEIWHDFMTAWIGLRDQRDASSGKQKDKQPEPFTPSVPQNLPPAEQAAPVETTPRKQKAPAGRAKPKETAPKQPAPQQPTPQPQPPPQQPPPQPGGGGVGAPG
jgi:penicillin-binding protein 1A